MTSTLPPTFEVPEESEGKRVDQALSHHFSTFSRSRWGEWIKKGKVLRNGAVAKAKDKVHYQDCLTLQMDPSTELRTQDSAIAQNIPLTIVHEDEDLLIIDKPAGLVVHPGAGNPNKTVLNALLHRYPNANLLTRGGIVHRLDKETTGLMIIAKTVAAQTRLIEQLQSRAIKRRYTTLVYGHLISGGTIQTLYGRHPRNRLKMAVLPQGKEAKTQYQITKQYQDFTLLKVSLATGRTHQIRVHFAHIRHPLVGDPLYGKGLRIPTDASELLEESLRTFKRQALHACELEFNHPIHGSPVHCRAPLPQDFQRLLDELNIYYGIR